MASGIYDNDGVFVPMKRDMPPAERYLNDALQYAVQTDKKDSVVMLLNQGADPNWICKISTNTPLQSALKLEHIEVFRVLLEHGARPDDCFDWLMGGNHGVADVIRKHPEVLTYLLDCGIKIDVHCSCKAWCKFVNKLTLVGPGSGIDLLRLYKELMNYVKTPIPKEVELKGHKFIVDDFGDDLRVILMFNAIHAKSIECVKLLLAQDGMPVNVLHKWNVLPITPLYFACQFNTLEIVKLLMSHGAEFISCTELLLSPLDVAFQKQSPEIVEFFLSNGFRSPTIEQFKLHAACLLQRVDQVRALIDEGVDVNETHLDVMYGASPLIICIRMKNLFLVKLMLKSGAHVPPIVDGTPENVFLSRHPIFHAIQAKDSSILQCILDAMCGKGSLKKKCHKSQRLLIMAAECSDFKSFNLLLKRGADYEAKDGKVAAIQAASKRGNLAMLKAVVKKGVCVNANAAAGPHVHHIGKGADGETIPECVCEEVDRRPLFLCQDVDCIRFLLEKGANIHSIGIAGYFRDHAGQACDNFCHINSLIRDIVSPSEKERIVAGLIASNAAKWDGRVEPCPPYLKRVEAGNIAGLEAYLDAEQGKPLLEVPYVLEQACLAGKFDMVKFLLKKNPKWLMALEDLEDLFGVHLDECPFCDDDEDEEEKDKTIQHDETSHVKMIAMLLNHGCTFNFPLKCIEEDDDDDDFLDEFEDEESDGEDWDVDYDSEDDEYRELSPREYAAAFLNISYKSQRFLCTKLLQEMCGRNLIIKSKHLLREIMVHDDIDMMRLMRVCGHKIAGKCFPKVEVFVAITSFTKMFQEFQEAADEIRCQPLDLQSICRIKIRSQIFEQMTEYRYINDLIQELPLAKPILDYLSFSGRHEFSYLAYTEDCSFPVKRNPSAPLREQRSCSCEHHSGDDDDLCSVM